MSADASPRVALLGVGGMGRGMARNILGAGLPLRVWDRNPLAAEQAVSLGASAADSAVEAVHGAELVVTMVFDYDAATDVVRSAAAGFGADTVWVQMGTVGVDGAERLAELAETLGVGYVDAPVLGTRKPAEDGALVVLASGPAELVDRSAPLFEAVGSRTVRAGAAGAGSRLKLVVNAWVLAVLEGVAESITLAGGLGLDPGLFLDALAGSALDTPYGETKGRAMLVNDFSVSFPVDGAIKDAGLILAAAESTGLAMDIAQVALRHLQDASAAGHGAEDMAAIIASRLRARAGP